MKTIQATTELSMFDLSQRGLVGIRDVIEIDLRKQIHKQLEDNWMDCVMIEQYTEPMTGIMKFRASLRMFEKGDMTPMKFIPYEAMKAVTCVKP